MVLRSILCVMSVIIVGAVLGTLFRYAWEKQGLADRQNLQEFYEGRETP